MVRRCWVNFQCRGVLLIWILVGQGPTVFAVGAGWGFLDIFFSHLSFFSSFFLSLGDGPIQIEILFQRVVKPKTTNQPRKFSLFIDRSLGTLVLYMGLLRSVFLCYFYFLIIVADGH